MYKHGFISISLGAILLLGCTEEHVVDFDSEGARLVRERACSQDWASAARKGAGAESFNASTLWSVSPYQVLVPSSGDGHVLLNVDAPHYDWLLYTTSDVRFEALDGPELTFNGPVSECPERGLVEYGAHHQELMSWPLLIRGEALSRARVYAGLAATAHSDPDQAGHAGHDLGGGEEAPTHGGH